MISENTIQSRVILMYACHRKAACHRLREMNRYTKQQRFFIAAWQECYQSNVLTKRKFRQKFGCKVPVPTTSTIMNIHRKAAETGTLEDEVRSGRPRLSGSRENLDRLHQSLVEDPHLSVRARARETGIPRESVRRLLRNDLQANPLRPKILQLLSEEDKAMRLVFCDEMSTILENDATFLDQLVFTDEANFHLNGAVNRHNCRYWATENPNFIISEPLHSPHTTVWAGVWAGGFIGPFFHDQTVNGERYLTMLETDVLPVQCSKRSKNDVTAVCGGSKTALRHTGTVLLANFSIIIFQNAGSAEADLLLGLLEVLISQHAIMGYGVT